MTDHQASRTLVKSAPELWAECSDAASLARHLGRFGEIRITRLEPETAVAWEGEHLSGTVTLEPSGWGTRVTLTARGSEPAVSAEIEDPDGTVRVPLQGEVTREGVVTGASAEQEPPGEVEDDPSPPLAGEGSPGDPPPPTAVKPRLLARLFGRRRRAASPASLAPPASPVSPASLAPPAPPVSPAPPEVKRDVDAVAEDDPSVNAVPAGPGSPADPVDSSKADGLAAGAAVDPPAILASALESLGQAHHRPYSRH
jgi:hypothetical protein